MQSGTLASGHDGSKSQLDAVWSRMREAALRGAWSAEWIVVDDGTREFTLRARPREEVSPAVVSLMEEAGDDADE